MNIKVKRISILGLGLLILSSCNLHKIDYEIFNRSFNNSVAIIGNLKLEVGYTKGSDEVEVIYTNLSNAEYSLDINYIRFVNAKTGEIIELANDKDDFVIPAKEYINKTYSNMVRPSSLCIRSNTFQYNVKLYTDDELVD